ncbi:MAG: 4-hydroxy-tetrahydrodipicolinate synthase [Deltaproteobacteria bacterium]|nr:4-hydroxy-tetrahydrodipicolinate synthase [Deltaproteobacteria bacterium]
MGLDLRGVLTALATPFEGGAVDEVRLRELVDWQIASGVHGLVVCGTTGEAAAMRADERAAAIACVVAQAAGRVPVVAGTGSNNTRATIEATRQAAELGADAALIVTPYYVKPTPAGLLAHYRAAAEVGLAIVAYNVPGRTGISLSPATAGALAGIDEIIGLKEASGDLALGARIASACAGRLALLSGDDATWLPFLAIGGQGVISVASNVAPKEMVALYERFSAGDIDGARAQHRALLPLYDALFVEPNPIPVKAALAMLGRTGAEIRTPLSPLGEPGREALRRVLLAGGWLEGSA